MPSNTADFQFYGNFRVVNAADGLPLLQITQGSPTIATALVQFGGFGVAKGMLNFTSCAVTHSFCTENGNVLIQCDVSSISLNNIVNCNSYYQVAGLKVVGARGAAVADATDAASVILRLNELLARLRASTGHGLIA
jgi:hypothetical protein